MACESKKKLKEKTSSCANSGRLEMWFDTKTEEKFNNNTTISDDILRNQRSLEDKTSLGYGGIKDKIYARKYISDLKQLTRSLKSLAYLLNELDSGMHILSIITIDIVYSNAWDVIVLAILQSIVIL